MVTTSETTGMLDLPHGSVALPAFLPDATLGVVRSLGFDDVLACGIDAVVMNTFHLMQRPGSSTIDALGGLNQMCGWRGPIVTDSGGFQAYSLIRENPRNGRLDSNGIHFKPGDGKRAFHLTPEKCIQLQMRYGSDVLICLDDCTHTDDPVDRQRESVERTIAWASRCKAEYTRLLDARRYSANRRPLLFGVVQGGNSHELRQNCSAALLDIGFDGFGYGGWPLDRDGNLLVDGLELTRTLIPRCFPMHALGIGHPVNVADCYHLGYELFDSSLPTRDARRGRLYTYSGNNANHYPDSGSKWFSYVYVQDDKHIKARNPISAFCDCLTCSTYSLGYLHHLFKIKDTTFSRLATIHNLRFMTQLLSNFRNMSGS